MSQRIGHVEHVMGTVVSFDISIADTVEQSGVRSAIRAAVAQLHRADEIFSTFRDDSQICRLGRGELTLDACDPAVAQVLDACAQVARASNGYFSSMYGGRLDPTGFVKGWAIQRASEVLLVAGFGCHSVNGGGDIQAHGEPEPGQPWNIAISHPLHRGAFAGVLAIRDGAVATSGSAERGAHVLDPFTGKPAAGLASVTVVGRELAYVDAYATAAFAMGSAARAWLEALDGYEAMAIAPDNTGWRTSGYDALAVQA
ncbi:MAG: FAD:protein FMN transferase [Acidothermaceae bacterium]